MSKAIANWKNEGEYPKWGSASMRRFAWEFLRRNPEYQKDWADYLDSCRRIIPSYEPHALSGESDNDLLEEHLDYFRYEPPRLDGEDENAWIDRVGRGSRITLHSWYAKKWGLRHHFHDPFFSYEKTAHGMLNIDFEKSPSVHVITKHWEGFKESGLHSMRKMEAIVFDYSIPLQPQLDAAKRYLESHQKWLIKEGAIEEFSGKIPRKEWVVHLRLLDADTVGIKPKEMAEVLYKNTENSYPNYGASKAASAALKIAKQWRDSWYKIIPSMKNPPCKN